MGVRVVLIRNKVLNYHFMIRWQCMVSHYCYMNFMTFVSPFLIAIEKERKAWLVYVSWSYTADIANYSIIFFTWDVWRQVGKLQTVACTVTEFKFSWSLSVGKSIKRDYIQRICVQGINPSTEFVSQCQCQSVNWNYY